MRLSVVLSVVALNFALWAALSATDASVRKPTSVFILADDTDYSGADCYGCEFDTPGLDVLPRHGLRFARFCNSTRCWPIGVALLTGY